MKLLLYKVQYCHGDKHFKLKSWIEFLSVYRNINFDQFFEKKFINCEFIREVDKSQVASRKVPYGEPSEKDALSGMSLRQDALIVEQEVCGDCSCV